METEKKKIKPSNIAAVKAVATKIPAGAWAVIGVVFAVVLLVLFLATAFGIFFSGGTDGEIPIREAVADISADFQAEIDEKINELSSGSGYDDVKVKYEGDFEGDSVITNNWTDVLTVFAVKYMGENVEVSTITPEKVDELKNLFRKMNKLTTRTETISESITVINEDGEEETETYTTLIIYIKVNSLTYEEGGVIFGFDDEQMGFAEEMMSPDYYILFADLLGVDLLSGADLTAIISNLPVGTTGAEVVTVALTKVGSPYVWGAKGSTKFDCSGLVYWSVNEVDSALGSRMYTNAAGQAKWCLDNGYAVGRSELQPGDLVFWQNLNCPGCGRWNEVHHTGIYIGDGKVVEASSGKGRVVVRDLWSSTNYPLYMYARPYEPNVLVKLQNSPE